MHRRAVHRTISRYLEKRTQFDRWPLENAPDTAPTCVVVIPVLAEHPGVFDTLGDLLLGSDQSQSSGHALAIVVVNNRADSVADDVAANQATLTQLRTTSPPHVCWIDASSAGCELPAGEGVGLARKIGLDWGLRLLAEGEREQAPLVCLDGDTRLDAQYHSAIASFFAGPSRWAGVLPYAHPLESCPVDQRAAIVCYELYLRYHALHLRWAGSPYAFHTIGSTIACTALAYASVSGMNRRQAGEDFYFLQQLAKTGPVETIPGTVVQPSARVSERVPFGTGRRVQRFLDGDREYHLHDPRSYEILRAWLAAINDDVDIDGDRLLTRASGIHPQLGVFLERQSLVSTWDRQRSQASSESALRRQFHGWFDGLRSMLLLHHLRDSVWPDSPMFGAIRVLLFRLGCEPVIELSGGSTPDLAEQEQLLTQLRQLSGEDAAPAGIS